MPAYQSDPTVIRTSAISGTLFYSYGSPSTYGPDDPGCSALVTSVAIASNVATVGLKITGGFKPVVNQLITIHGTQTATSGGAPNFNVTNVALASVSGFNTGDNSTGTVTFALTSNNISTTTDAGEAYMPPLETADVCANGSGQQVALPTPSGFPSTSRDVQWSTKTPSAPSAYTANLQGALVDQDSEYTTIDTMTTPGNQTKTGVRANFLRVNLSGVSGGSSPTIVARIEV
jgi:hypothetical protein